MGKLDDTIQKLKSIDVDQAVDQALESSKNDMVELNLEQLDIGMKSDGSSMPPYSSNSPKSGKIRLYDTGDFWRGFFARDTGKAFEISSSDDKTDELQQKYDPIFGLVKKQMEELARRVKPKFVNLLKQQIK